ncbi:GPO family capsid scaffolding protein [Acinetobacter modestus]|uniref:GPO family capsid scaffolding protein n=1 Tax=Acinetobacter modestus TaxID=1776740 RepID=UPI001F4A9F78|nr:GPO family capsid scaffolding protein [Acinetobacter modestus]MCH7388215.1 GPO family capsid scaffolding protein [Acinetobacter modestus]
MAELPGEGRVIKRFRVAREGQTVDGRELTRQEIQEMADTYNLEHYAGRINIEHLSGWSPEPPFNAYGDILKVEAVDENGKLHLYNEISALPNFVAMNKKGQKIYPSIEFYRNFAGTGKAYQVGLGMTDTPASLGTQAIKFSNNRHSLSTQPDSEIYITMSEKNPNEGKSLLDQIKEALTPTPKPQNQSAVSEELAGVLTQGLVQCLHGLKTLTEEVGALKQTLNAPPAAAPIPQPTPAVQTPPAAAPEQQSTQNPPAAPGANLEATLQQLAQSMTGLQNQFHAMSTTPMNPPPVQSGSTANTVDY